MTWYYEISSDSRSADVYDHTGTLITTIDNNGTGFSKQDVLEVMHSELHAALSNSNSSRAIEIAADAACEQIERGSPA